jgi:ribosome-associated heat shock protein Hsp15
MTVEGLGKARIDRWLWAVRLFKTRTLAVDACRGGKVRIAGDKIKPSRSVKLGETITIQSGPMTKTVRVLALLEKRVGAKVIPQFLEDLTSPEEYEKLKQTIAQTILKRERGAGRPTKRDRRQLEQLFEGEGEF